MHLEEGCAASLYCRHRSTGAKRRHSAASLQRRWSGGGGGGGGGACLNPSTRYMAGAVYALCLRMVRKRAPSRRSTSKKAFLLLLRKYPHLSSRICLLHAGFSRLAVNVVADLLRKKPPESSRSRRPRLPTTNRLPGLCTERPDLLLEGRLTRIKL